MEDFQAELSNLIDNIRREEEKLIISVLEHLLKRPPTIKDFKKCEIHIFEGAPDSYKLYMEGVYIGDFRRVYQNNFIANPVAEYKSMCTLTFTPSELF